MPYNGSQIAIEDREILCKGLCVVIASLSPGQDVLSKLTHPILSCINVTVKEAETNTCERRSILQRLANEIQLLASVVKHYVRTDAPERFELLSAMLQKSWPTFAIIVEKYSSEEVRCTYTPRLSSLDCISLHFSFISLYRYIECGRIHFTANKGIIVTL